MPLYEFHCPNCDLVYETLSSRKSGEGGFICPNCDTTGERVLSTFSWKNQTPNYIKYKQESDEKMFYAERRLNEDKTLDPVAWLDRIRESKKLERTKAK